MEIIPLIHLKSRKILTEKDGNNISLDEVLEQVEKDGKIYVLDTDGIEKNKPNLCLYPKISECLKIWVDAGPRVIGDVVDAVVAGATNITVRRNLWRELDVSSIREITESEIYVDIDLKNQDNPNVDAALFYGADGLVVFNNKNQIVGDFKTGGFLKSLCKKYKTYAHESNLKNSSYWKTLGVAGQLVDISMIREFKKNGF